MRCSVIWNPEKLRILFFQNKKEESAKPGMSIGMFSRSGTASIDPRGRDPCGNSRNVGSESTARVSPS